MKVSPSQRQVRPVLVFSQDRRSGSYRPLMRFETMPSRPRSDASRWKAGPWPI